MEATETGQQEGLAGQASAKMEDAASAAQEQASEWREQGSARLRDQFDQRSTQAGSQVRSLAEALRRSATELGNEGNGSASQLTKQAADRIERVGSYLEQKSGDEHPDRQAEIEEAELPQPQQRPVGHHAEQ